MPACSGVDDFVRKLKSICSAVRSVSDVELKGNRIKYFTFGTNTLENLAVRQLEVSDAPDLHRFYFHDLSNASRKLFASYPLFSSLPASAEDLANRIREWKREDDWVFFNVWNDSRIIAAGFLKRCATDKPTSGIAVSDEYHRMGLGYIVQCVVDLQAYLLNLKKLYIKVEQGNAASFKLHEKCGFKQIGIVPYAVYNDDWVKVEQPVIEMVLDFTDWKI